MSKRARLEIVPTATKTLAVCMIHGYDTPPSLPWQAWNDWCDGQNVRLYVILNAPLKTKYKNIVDVADTEGCLKDAWGTYKQVIALQQVLKVALASQDVTHFAPITGSSLPLISAATMVRKLKKDSTLPGCSSNTYEVPVNKKICEVHMRSPYGILTREAATFVSNEVIEHYEAVQLELCKNYDGFLAWDELHTEATLVAHNVDFKTCDTMYAVFDYSDKHVNYKTFKDLNALIEKAKEVSAGGRAKEHTFTALMEMTQYDQYMFGRKCQMMTGSDVRSWKHILMFTDKAI